MCIASSMELIAIASTIAYCLECSYCSYTIFYNFISR